MTRKTPAKKSTPKKASETQLVRDLADILNDTDLAEIEMRKGDLKIRVSKHGGGAVYSAAPAPVMAAPAVAAVSAPAPETPAPKSAADASAHPGAVKSPMVGTAYVRPSPEADQFVKVGDKVKEGDTVLLVEAMKTFNPITAPKSGKIEEILVDDAQPVEFGETLFIIV
ncbi:MAG: acetyl-CoA carboxylase biotin carboxyl carrier protein [Maricaulaceae bacterium]